MSPREPVDRGRIREFLLELSCRFRHTARILLVGGTTMVYEGLRGKTLDIGVKLVVEPRYHGELIRAIRDLKDELDVNVEEAAPDEFIPLPSGSDRRHEYVGRFGEIDGYHYDLYSTALSKIERGRTQDIEDVLDLLRAGRIRWEELSSFFDEILPAVGTAGLRQDPEAFRANFEHLERRFHEAR